MPFITTSSKQGTKKVLFLFELPLLNHACLSRVRLTKRRPKPGEPATSNTRLVLKHRSLTAREHRMFRQRERQLEPANQAEDEEEVDDEEEEDDEEGAAGGQRLSKDEEKDADAKDADSDAQSDRSRSRSRSASRSKSKSPSAASSSRSRSSSAASSRRSVSPAPAAQVEDKKYGFPVFFFFGH